MANNVVNLNRVRKATDKVKSQIIADSNAVKFGRTKTEKSSEAISVERDRQKLDAHKRKPEK